MQSVKGHSKDISTHSLTRRLTFEPETVQLGSTDFNSQPHKEADSVIRYRKPKNVFQLTASQGG